MDFLLSYDKTEIDFIPLNKQISLIEFKIVFSKVCNTSKVK
jgi:hypothetical protein